MATVTISGTAAEIKNLTLADNDDTQVAFLRPANSVTIKCRTAVAIQVRTSRNSPDYYTIPSGGSLTLGVEGSMNLDGTVKPTNIWLRSGTGSVVAEIISLSGG